MDKKLYDDSIEYEKLTRRIYQEILEKEGVENIQVEHNVALQGRSGVEHQIDVLWKFKQAGIEHKVLIECKNYTSSLTLEKVRNFFAVVHDIGNSNGLLVTKTGFQSGTKKFADFYGIGMKLLREPESADYQGRIQTINTMFIAKMVSEAPGKEPRVGVVFDAESTEEENKLKQLEEEGALNIPFDSEFCFLDCKGNKATERMGSFLPQNITVLERDDGGPYEQKIKLDDKYVLVQRSSGESELIKVRGIVVTFYVESESNEIIQDAKDVVEAIVKDYQTGQIEHVHRKA